MKRVLLIALLAATPAYAQQPDLARIISVLEQQRNMAFTLHAQAEARAAELAEENAKLKAQIADLKSKIPAEAAK